MKQNDRKMFYFLVGCIILSLVIVGATYAYFTANATNDTVVRGDSATTSFSLRVEKITDADNAFGLIPMRNNQAPNSVKQKCRDDNNNGGCQIYKIIVESDSDTIMFLDGYIVTEPSDSRLETRFASIYTEDDEETFNTKFTADDFSDVNTLKSEYTADLGIKSGKLGSREDEEVVSLNHTDDFDCLFVSNEKIGGDIGRSRVFYVVMWVFDNGANQNYLQGLQLAYRGTVTFVTAEGNEISATFD